MPTRPLVTSYEQDLRLFPDRWHHVGIAVVVVALLAFPFLASSRWLTVADLACVTVVGSVGLMILTGFAGQISLGHAAFLALGAYTAAILGERFGMPFWLILPISGAVAAAAGLAIGPFALRLRGLYLAIVTIGLLFLVNHMLLSFPEWTHGVSGIAVPRYWWFPGDDAASRAAFAFRTKSEVFGVTLDARQKLYFVFVLIAALAAYGARNLARSNTGRAMMAVRDHDLAASVLGVSPSRAKITSFGISSFVAGVAGAMFAFQQQYITVEPPFDLNMSIQYIAMIVLGGIGTTFGAVVGAVAFVFLTPVAEEIGRHTPLLDRMSSHQQSTVLFAVIVCGFLLFEPRGLLGIWLRIKRYFQTWPFRY